jgi:O-antigen/teichoic acid export membrane protein
VTLPDTRAHQTSAVSYLLSGTAYGILTLAAAKLLQLVLKLLVARLGVAQFGTYYLVTTTFTGLTTFAAMGIPMSITRFVSLHESSGTDSRTTVTFGILILGGIGIAVTAAAVFVPGLLTPGTAVSQFPYLQLIAWGLTGALFTQLAKAVYLGHLNVKSGYTVELTDLTVRFGCVIAGMAVWNLGLAGAVTGYAAGATAVGIGAVLMLVRNGYVTTRTAVFPRALIAYTWPVSASEIVSAMGGAGLIWYLNQTAGSGEVGIYAAGVSVASLINILPQLVLPVFLPVITRLHGRGDAIFHVYRLVETILTAAVLTAAVILAAVRSPVISAVFGPAYARSATILIPLLSAYAWYAVIVWPNRQILDMAGYTKQNLALTLLRYAVCGMAILTIPGKPSGTTIAVGLLCGWLAEGVGCIWWIRRKGIITA